MQVTEFIFDPAANCVKFLMIAIGMIVHTVMINVTAKIMITITQVLHRIVPDFLVLNGLRMITNLYAFVPLILVVPSMVSSRIMSTILLVRVMMHVIGSAVTEDAGLSFASVPVSGHIVIYLLAVPRYIIAKVRKMTLVSRLLQRTSMRQRPACIRLCTSSLQISSVWTALA